MLFGIKKHIPTFNGRHNANKSKIWRLLYEHKPNRLTLDTIHWSTGIPRHSLSTQLARWTRWDYLSRSETSNGVYCYRLKVKGIEWICRWQSIIPWARYLTEIREWQQRNNVN